VLYKLTSYLLTHMDVAIKLLPIVIGIDVATVIAIINVIVNCNEYWLCRFSPIHTHFKHD